MPAIECPATEAIMRGSLVLGLMLGFSVIAVGPPLLDAAVADEACYTCKMVIDPPQTVGCDAGGSRGHCNFNCDQQGCTCAAGGECAVSMRLNGVLPDGRVVGGVDIRSSSLLADGDAEGAVLRACGEGVASRSYSKEHEQMIRERLSRLEV
jgi:hypothetical protein